jgi:hypothetical protein
MCGLCLQSNPFAAVPVTTAEDALKRRASQLKASILQYETQLFNTIGPVCVASWERLQQMKAEQYEIAKKL